MDYFPNGDFAKSYPLPGISYYMSSMSTTSGLGAAAGSSMGNHQPLGHQQQQLPSHQQSMVGLGLTNPSVFDGQQFLDTSDFSSAFQHHHHQPYGGVPQPTLPPQPHVNMRQYGSSGGQKRKSAAAAAAAAAAYQQQYHHHQQQQLQQGQEENGGIDGDKDRKVDPFAPECSIPLPYQLGDEYSYYGPTAVWKRNERERHRVRCVNEGYEKLRHHLPVPDNDKRLSKVETLRFAIRYIQHLEKLLADARHDETCDCDFTVRSSSVSDSCQSPAVSTTADRQQQRRVQPQRRGKKAAAGSGGRKYARRRVSSDDSSDEG